MPLQKLLPRDNGGCFQGCFWLRDAAVCSYRHPTTKWGNVHLEARIDLMLFFMSDTLYTACPPLDQHHKHTLVELHGDRNKG